MARAAVLGKLVAIREPAQAMLGQAWQMPSGNTMSAREYDQRRALQERFDCLLVGAGPAGLMAAVGHGAIAATGIPALAGHATLGELA